MFNFNERPLSVVLTTDDLQELMRETVKETVKELNQKKEEEVVWLSPSQVSERLGKNKATLWRWDKEGYLRVHKFGNRSRYKLSDIERIEGAEKKGGER